MYERESTVRKRGEEPSVEEGVRDRERREQRCLETAGKGIVERAAPGLRHGIKSPRRGIKKRWKKKSPTRTANME